jgi:predicted GH43/DUF377 family glycosyl hydrolase
MKWVRQGLIFCPDKNFPWMWSHAANPCPLHLDGDRYRIYFSCRDESKKSSVGFIEIDLKQPQEILVLSDKPVLGPGEKGLFDDSGISLGNIFERNNKYYLYYTGWHLDDKVPWRNTIGLATSDADFDFKKFDTEPVLGLSQQDPHSLSYPFVRYDGDRFKMWYGSNASWGKTPNAMIHGIRYAESGDGAQWNTFTEWCLYPSQKSEFAFSRPCVRPADRGYEMWYAYRGDFYKIGYAVSEDGLCWKRRDDYRGLSPSGKGWDSDSVAYPYVFDHRDQTYMLYCGNGYGATGFGLVKLARP